MAAKRTNKRSHGYRETKSGTPYRIEEAHGNDNRVGTGRVSGGDPPDADDAVRVYLTEIGRDKLLTAEEQAEIGDRIARLRMAYRQNLLNHHVVLCAVARLFKQLRNGQLRLDRTLDVAASDREKKEELRAALEMNLNTMVHLLDQNERDHARLRAGELQPTDHQATKARIRRRRHKCVRLVEKVALKIDKLEPLRDMIGIRSCYPALAHHMQYGISGVWCAKPGTSEGIAGRSVEPDPTDLHMVSAVGGGANHLDGTFGPVLFPDDENHFVQFIA